MHCIKKKAGTKEKCQKRNVYKTHYDHVFAAFSNLRVDEKSEQQTLELRRKINKTRPLSFKKFTKTKYVASNFQQHIMKDQQEHKGIWDTVYRSEVQDQTPIATLFLSSLCL